MGAFPDIKEALAWAESGQIPPEFPLFAIYTVDNAFYRLMGVPVGGTAWERLPGTYGDDRAAADRAKKEAELSGRWQAVMVGLDTEESPRPELN
jgi:hypothetical protein